MNEYHTSKASAQAHLSCPFMHDEFALGGWKNVDVQLSLLDALLRRGTYELGFLLSIRIPSRLQPDISW